MSSLLEDILVCKAYKILTPEKENTKDQCHTHKRRGGQGG